MANIFLFLSLETPLARISGELKDTVVSMLDSPSSSRGWYNIGIELGIDNVILDFIETSRQRDESSPTANLFEYLNGTQFVRAFVEALHRIQRDDIV